CAQKIINLFFSQAVRKTGGLFGSFKFLAWVMIYTSFAYCPSVITPQRRQASIGCTGACRGMLGCKPALNIACVSLIKRFLMFRVEPLGESCQVASVSGKCIC